MRPRLLLADDHTLFVQALAELLGTRYEVVDIVGDGQALQKSAQQHKPDVIVTDITMPLMSGLEAIRSLRREKHTPKIVFLTMHADAQLARECFRCGGSGFVNKEFSYEELTVAIDAVLENRLYLSPTIAASLIDVLKAPGDPAADLQQITPRQREILQLFAEGKTTKEIASITNLSTRTVEWHKYRMMRTLGVQRGAELIQYAVRMKLVV